MKTLHFTIIIAAAYIMIFTTAQAWAVSLDVDINPHENVAKPTFVFSNTIFIEYPDGGEIKQNLRGKGLFLDFNATSITPGISDLISKLNGKLEDSHSSARITNLDMKYHAKIFDGREDLSIVEYSIVFKPTIVNITNSVSPDNSTLIDSKWRTFFVDGHVVINTNRYGKYDINNPLSVFENLSPTVYQILVQNKKNILDFPIIDSRDLSKPLSDWQLGCDSNVYSGHILPTFTKFSMTTQSYVETQLLESPLKNQARITADKTYLIQVLDDGSTAEISSDGYVRPDTLNNIEYLKSLPLASNQLISQDKDVFGATSSDCMEKLLVQPTVSKSNKQLYIKTILADTRGFPLSNVKYTISVEQDNHVMLQSNTTNDIMTHYSLMDSNNPVDVKLTIHNQTTHGLRGIFDFQVQNDGSVSITNPSVAIHTDKESYSRNDQIIIRGHAYNLIGPKYSVYFAFQDPRGYYVYQNDADVKEDDGAFVAVINPKKDYSQQIGNSSWARGGNYTLNIGTFGEQSKTNFYFSGFTPRQQLHLGISPHFVKCPTGFDLVTRARDGYPACVTSSSLSRLVENNWTVEKFVRASNSNYSALYSISNGTLVGMEYDPKSVSITLSINTHSDGRIWLTIPRPFSSDDVDGNDITYFVNEDGQNSYDSFPDKGEYKTTITIPFKNGVKKIQISHPCYGGC